MTTIRDESSQDPGGGGDAISELNRTGGGECDDECHSGRGAKDGEEDD